MSTDSTPTFTCFSRLPAELRLQVWEEALLVRTVWAAYRNPTAEKDSDPTHPPFTMHFVGPKPFLVGLTCKEARQVMEKIYIPLTRSRAGSVTTTHWIDPDMTVVHFGDCDAGIAVLCDLLADGASKLKHVAVRWYFGYLPQIIRFSRQLEDRCPGLHTLVIRQAFKPTPADDTAQRPLPVESASVLALAPTDDKENFGILPASEFRCMTRLA